MAATLAATLTGCHVPGGGWTLRAGCDLREHKKPAVYMEMVDTHWDEQRRVAACNAYWSHWAGSATPVPVPQVPPGHLSGSQPDPASMIRPQMPATHAPVAPAPLPPASQPAAPMPGTEAGNLVPPPLPPAEATVEPAVTHAAVPQRQVIPRLGSPSSSESTKGHLLIDEESADALDEPPQQREIGAHPELAEEAGNITLSEFHVTRDRSDFAQPGAGSTSAARPKAPSRRASAIQLFRRPVGR